MVLNNEIPDGKTQVAVLKAAMLLNHKKGLIEKVKAQVSLPALLIYIISVNLLLFFSNFLVQCRQAVSAFVSLRISFCRFPLLFLIAFFDIFFLSLYNIYKLFYHFVIIILLSKINKNGITALSYFSLAILQ